MGFMLVFNYITRVLSIMHLIKGRGVMAKGKSSGSMEPEDHQALSFFLVRISLLFIRRTVVERSLSSSFCVMLWMVSS